MNDDYKQLKEDADSDKADIEMIEIATNEGQDDAVSSSLMDIAKSGDGGAKDLNFNENDENRTEMHIAQMIHFEDPNLSDNELTNKYTALDKYLSTEL